MKSQESLNFDKKNLKQGVYYLSEPQHDPEFENLYLKVRTIEKRVFNDEEVKRLPFISAENRHKKEWGLRINSTNRFLNYLKKQQVKNVLEVGCGNGWFCNRMAEATNAEITGVDVNRLELEQASRLFKKDNLKFTYGDIFERIFPAETFDIIVINSAVQYFQDIEKLIQRLFYFLAKDGEIHFLDSPFYKVNEVNGAKKRTADYFRSLDAAEMENHYFHHAYDRLKPFDFKVLYAPGSIKNKLIQIFTGQDSPFPWIRIKAKRIIT
jgi:SAM-dependent methyltransferase